MSEIANVNIYSIAQDLLENDNDGIITEEEIEAYVSKSDTEDKLARISLSKTDAAKQLADIFKSEGFDENTIKDDSTEEDDKTFSLEHYNALKAKAAQLNAMIEELGGKKIALNSELEDLNGQLKSATDAYEDLENRLMQENDELSSVAKKIDATQDLAQRDIELKQRRALHKAVADYNPEEDGDDFDKYLADTFSSQSITSDYCTSLAGLVKNSKVKQEALQSLSKQLQSQETIVKNLENQISDTVSALGSVDSMIETTQVQLDSVNEELKSCVLSMVTEAEMNLVTDNKIDLEEQLEDGNPRYIFAKGKEDGNFHIYDMQQGASLARLYGCDGSGLRGSDIVPCGNGYIYDYNVLDDDSQGGEEIFYFTKCQGMQSKRACYQTCSPLEFSLMNKNDFSLNTNSTVDFDIDGDGKVDHINDTNNAVLVFDADGDGEIGEDGKEVFGNNTDLSRFGINQKFNNGFEALNALADVARKDGLIDGDDVLDADELAKMEEAYGFKIKANGYGSEAQSFADVGISQINLSNSAVSDKKTFDEFGNEIQTQEGASFVVNGEEHNYADVWHRMYSDSDAQSIQNGTFDPNTQSASDSSSKNIAQANQLLEHSSSLNIRAQDLYGQTSQTQVNVQNAQDAAKKAIAKQDDNNFFLNAQKPHTPEVKDEATEEPVEEVEEEVPEVEIEEEIVEEELLEEEKEE